MPLGDGAQLAQPDNADILLDNVDVDDPVVGSFPFVFDPAEQRW
jgi:hypothetical protein